MHELVFGKECETASNKLHAELYNSTATRSLHIKWISGLILCTLYSSDHCLFLPFNKLEIVRKKMVMT